MTDINVVAQEFIRFYYQTFTSNRAGLGALYQPQSMLTFEGQQFQGGQAIAEKLASLPIFKLEPQIDTMDVQVSNPNMGSIMICITGRLVIDNESQPQRFSQTFNLYPSGAGSYFVFNDIFRLNYG